MNAYRALTLVVSLTVVGWFPTTCLGAAFVSNNVIDLKWSNQGHTCTYHVNELLRAVNHALEGCPPARIRAALVEDNSTAPSGGERQADRLAGLRGDLTAEQRN